MALIPKNVDDIINNRTCNNSEDGGNTAVVIFPELKSKEHNVSTMGVDLEKIEAWRYCAYKAQLEKLMRKRDQPVMPPNLNA